MKFFYTKPLLVAGIIVLSIATSVASGAELSLLQGKLYTSLRVNVDEQEVSQVIRSATTVEIVLTRRIAENINTVIDDQYIYGVTSTGNSIIVRAQDGAKMNVSIAPKWVNIIASKVVPGENVLSSYVLFPSIPTPGVQGHTPEIPERMVQEGYGQLDVGDYAGAMQSFNRAISLTKGTNYAQRTLFSAGQAFYDAAEGAEDDEPLYRQSAKYFATLMEDYPNAYLPLSLISQAANAERKSFNYIRSIELYKMLVDLAPDVASRREATLNLADTNLLQGNIREALEIYEKFTDDYPRESSIVMPKLGFLYEQQDLPVVSRYYYDRFEVYEPTLSLYSDDILLSMYNSYKSRGKSEKATKLSKYILKTSMENPMAFAYVTYEQAKIHEKQGDTVERDRLFLECINLFPEAEYCKRGSWEYALAHLDERDYEYWRGFFGVGDIAELGEFDDEVFYILTLSMLKSGDYENVIKAVDLFHSKYDTSKRYDDQAFLKEEAIFKTGVELYAEGKTAEGKMVMEHYYEAYPEGAFVDSLYSIEDEESYRYVRGLFENGSYLDAMSAAQSYTANRGDLISSTDRWDNLYRDAYYGEVMQRLDSVDGVNGVNGANGANAVNTPNGVRNPKATALAMAKDFVENYANETYNDVGTVVDTLLYSTLNDLYNKGLYSDVASTYNTNKDYFDNQGNKTLSAGSGILVGLSLVNMGDYDAATNTYYAITPEDATNVDSKLYTALGIIVGDENHNVNVFNENEMDFVVASVTQRDREEAYRIAQEYTRNASHSLSMQYDLYASETDRIKKLVMIESLYANLVNNRAVTFDKAYFIYLDYGITRYDQGRYTDAIASLSTFIRMYRQGDDATGQGLYFLAKSYHNLGDLERAQVYYEMVGESAPSSIYASLASSELSSAQWRSGLGM